MADFGISIAEKLLEAIGNELIKEVCNMWGYKSQLDDLKETVSTIRKVLLDADARRELSYEERNYIDKLKDAVYDADDLFDEFLTLAELKQLRPLSKRENIYEKVRCFFSSKNQLGQAYRMSRDVKSIKKRLDDIADTHKKFGFSVDYKPIIRRKEKTCSYVDANEIIGRDKDKEAIIKMLLDRNNEEICFMTIVGVGGLGKTALAQLVYDDERINKEFSKNLKFWVCVSDQEGEQFVVKTILCFFQDVVKTELDNIMFVKIHDLMHDVAQEIGREEICVVNRIPSTLGVKIRHVCYIGDSCLENTLGSSKVRSFICRGYGTCVVDVHTQIKNQMCLRVLELSKLDVVKLPDSIGKLQHLRYLNFSENKNLEILPNAITRLHNLLTLILRECSNLRELPKHFSKLIKLRHLDLFGCENLICMPLGLEKLTNLEVLPYFVVGKIASKDDGLEALKSFNRVRGDIWIQVGEHYRKVEGINEGMGGYLKSMKHLMEVRIQFESGCDNSEKVLETLNPPSSVRALYIFYYEGARIPKWGRVMDNWAHSFSHLVHVWLDSCKNLEEMPILSKLPLLKMLTLQFLHELEYMEEIRSNNGGSDTQSTELFFPSLIRLEITYLEKLKGWWKEDSSSLSSEVDDNHCCCLNRRLRFPCLSELLIDGCPNLISFPSCPTIDTLWLRRSNIKLRINIVANTTSEDNNEEIVRNSQLHFLQTDYMGHLKSLPINCLTTLGISGDQEVNVLSQSGKVESDVSEAFERCAHSLQKLEIRRMNNLRRLCGPTGLQHFTALESLTLGYSSSGMVYDEVEEEDEYENDDNNLIWSSIPQNLRSLEFQYLRKVTSLPKAMQYMTTLQDLTLRYCMKLQALPEWIGSFSSLKSLFIYNCPALKSLPEAMPQLTSLQTLTIWNCPALARRCEKPDGEDYPKIKHIPHII
ncbi:putative disease resistance protein RGA4, partial [Bienertia sinuspersici]